MRDRRWLAAAAVVGLFAVLFQTRGRMVSLTEEVFLVKAAAQPALYHGDPLLLQTTRTGYYDLIGRAVGGVFAVIGVGADAVGGLEALQLLFWLLQAGLFFLIARRLTGSDRVAFLASVLFCWGTPLLAFVDAADCPTLSFGRSAGLVGCLAALWLYFEEKPLAAWCVAALSVYLHASPAVGFLILFTLSDCYSIYKRKTGLSSFMLRLLTALAILGPLEWYMATQGTAAKIYENFLLTGAGIGDLTYGRSTWLLSFEGVAFVVLAWKFSPKLAGGDRVKDLLLASLIPLAGGTLTRAVLHPMGFPSAFLLEVTTGYSYLTLFQLLGIVLVSRWLVDLYDNEMPLWPLLAAALLAARRGDFVVRTLAVALMVPPNFRAGAGLALWVIGNFAPKILPVRGGMFALPFFGAGGAALMVLALATKFIHRKEIIAALIVLVCAFQFRAPADPPDEPWRAALTWVKDNTPADALVLAPFGKDINEALVLSERAVVSPEIGNDQMMLILHQAASVPYLERAQKAFGWNYKTVKSFDDMRAQMKFFRGGDSKNLENAARSLGLSFVMVGRSFDPLASHGAKPLFSNEAYAVYGLRP